MSFENIDLSNKQENIENSDNVVEELVFKIEDDNLNKEEIVEEAEKMGGIEKLMNKVQDKIKDFQKKIKVYTKLALLVGAVSLPAAGQTSEEKSFEKDGNPTEQISEKESLLKKEIKEAMWSRAENGLGLIGEHNIEIFCLENPDIKKDDANRIFQAAKREVREEFIKLEKDKKEEKERMIKEFESIDENEKIILSPEKQAQVDLEREVAGVITGEKIGLRFIPPTEDIIEAYKKGEFQNKEEFFKWKIEKRITSVKNFIREQLRDSSQTEKQIKEECIDRYISFFGKVAAEEEIKKIYSEIVNK